jgi:hypothetical protein
MGYLFPQFWHGPYKGGLALVFNHLGWPGITPVLPFLLLWGAMAAVLIRLARDASSQLSEMATRPSPGFGA